MKKLKTKTLSLNCMFRHKYGRKIAGVLAAVMVTMNCGTRIPAAFAAGEVPEEMEKAYETASSSNATATDSDAEEIFEDEEFLLDDRVLESSAASQEMRTVNLALEEPITIIFDSNGGSVDAPEAITKGSGESVELPDYEGTKEAAVFVGWSALKNPHNSGAYAGGDGAIYPVGASYTVPEEDITLYAVWSSQDVDAKFFVRLDGIIPTEPQAHPTSNYTKGIFKSGVLKTAAFYTDSSEGVDSRLNEEAMPTDEELVELLAQTSGKISFSDETVYDKTIRASEFGEKYYVLWYVIKSEDGWHVDGVLLKKELVNLAYDANAPEGTWSNMPDGRQYPDGSIAKVSDRKPSREGYEFLGWNTSADGTGKRYTPGQIFEITENTTLYAQWKKTDPTDPTEPTEPTDPTDPTEPTNPTEPTDPTEPTEPTEPTDPTSPTNPTIPSQSDEDHGGSSGGDGSHSNGGGSSSGGSSSGGSHSSGSGSSSGPRSTGSSSGGPGVVAVKTESSVPAPNSEAALSLPGQSVEDGIKNSTVTSNKYTASKTSLPKTGQDHTKEWTFVLSTILFAAAAAANKKLKEE